MFLLLKLKLPHKKMDALSGPFRETVDPLESVRGPEKSSSTSKYLEYCFTSFCCCLNVRTSEPLYFSLGTRGTVSNRRLNCLPPIAVLCESHQIPSDKCFLFPEPITAFHHSLLPLIPSRIPRVSDSHPAATIANSQSRR